MFIINLAAHTAEHLFPTEYSVGVPSSRKAGLQRPQTVPSNAKSAAFFAEIEPILNGNVQQKIQAQTGG
jgi:hypothetical protein